jgi:hypothetical protein
VLSFHHPSAQFQEHIFANRTLLLSTLFGLATEQSRVDKEKILSGSFQDYQSQFLTVTVARVVLLRSSVDCPCRLQLMMGDRLSMKKLLRKVWDLLSALCISMFLLNLDNFGFKETAGKKTEAVLSSTHIVATLHFPSLLCIPRLICEVGD